MESPTNEEKLNTTEVGESRGKRPRILRNMKHTKPVIDNMLYTSNLCSDKARKIRSLNVKNEIEIWFDKHYSDRLQFGDNNGKREGIENQVVISLVERSIDHLLFYSSCIKNFTFLNHNVNGNRAIRVVLQQEMNDSILNVVIEAHCDKIYCYEITVKTAMCIDDFKISDGQYSLDINGSNSTLSKCDRQKIIEIYSI